MNKTILILGLLGALAFQVFDAKTPREPSIEFEDVDEE